MAGKDEGMRSRQKRCVFLPLAVMLPWAAACGDAPPRAEVGQDSAAAHAEPIGQAVQQRGMRPGLNPLQHEMVLLDSALREVVTLLSYNALAGVPGLFHPVHAARDSTVAFLARGEYRLPKSPEAMADFELEDAAFHEQLEALVASAAAEDLAGATAQAGRVLDACTRCHLRFRF